MKEKLLKVKEQILQNKKKAAAIGIAVLLLIGAGGYGVAALNMNNETAKTVQTEKKSADQKSVKKETADKTSKKVDAAENSEKKSADDKKEIKKTENEKKSTEKDNNVKSSGGGSTNSSQPTGNANTQPSVPEPDPVPQPEPAPQPEPDPAPPVHVHDYSNPIYGEQSVWIDTSGYVSKEILRCGICDEDVTGFEGKHLEDHALAGEGVGNTYSDWKEEWEESGYWGTESVITGYKCSCGAVQ